MDIEFTKVLEVVYAAIDELNEQLPADEPLSKSPETVLFGSDGSLDSMGLVNLITIAEQKIEESFGHPITLADERAFSAEESPFKTVGSLSKYVVGVLQETPAG